MYFFHSSTCFTSSTEPVGGTDGEDRLSPFVRASYSWKCKHESYILRWDHVLLNIYVILCKGHQQYFLMLKHNPVNTGVSFLKGKFDSCFKFYHLILTILHFHIKLKGFQYLSSVFSYSQIIIAKLLFCVLKKYYWRQMKAIFSFLVNVNINLSVTQLREEPGLLMDLL